ncbi:hypothetical protein HK104_007077, partial [Borealophlyctis nickersoniae]
MSTTKHSAFHPTIGHTPDTAVYTQAPVTAAAAEVPIDKSAPRSALHSPLHSVKFAQEPAVVLQRSPSASSISSVASDSCSSRSESPTPPPTRRRASLLSSFEKKLQLAPPLAEESAKPPISRATDWFNHGLGIMAEQRDGAGGIGGVGAAYYGTTEWFMRTTQCRVMVEESSHRVFHPLETAPLIAPAHSALSVSVETPLSHALRTMHERNVDALALYAMEQEYTPDTDEVVEKPVYRGIVNIMDVLNYIVGCLTDSSDTVVDPDALFEKQVGDLLGKT